MNKSQTLKYIIEFEKKTGALKAAGLDVDELTKKTGKDQPEAAKKAESAYKNWLTSAKENVHLLRSPMELLHKVIGGVTGVVGLAIVAWELYKGSTDKVIKATEESYDKHLDLIRAMDGATRSGVELTDSQKKYQKALEAVLEVEGRKLAEAYEKKAKAVQTNIETVEKQLVLYEKMRQQEAQHVVGVHLSAESYQGAKDRLTELNAQLAEYNSQIDSHTGKTKNEQDALDRQKKAADAKRQLFEIEQQNKINHDQAMLQLEKSGAQEILQDITKTAEEKKARLEKIAADSIAIRRAQLDSELADANHQADTEFFSAETRAAKLKGIEQKAADGIVDIRKNLAREENKIDQEKHKRLVATLQAEMHAFSSAFAQRIAQTHNLGSALQAAGANVINVMADQAATKIEILGAEAAAAAFENGMIAGGPIAAVAAAASTMVFYTGLAAIVGGAGAVVAGAIDPGAGGGGAAPGSSSSSPTYTAPADSSSVSSGSMVPAGAGGGPGAGTINVALYLDREVILRLIQRASFSGELQISANAITP